MISTNIIKGATMVSASSDIDRIRIRIDLIFNVAMGMVGLYDSFTQCEPTIWINMNGEDYELIYELDEHFDHLAEGESGRLFEEVKEWVKPWL